MSRKREEYDWIDDPFDDSKKTKLDQGMSSGSKAAIAVALVLVVIALLVVCGVALFGMADVMRSV